MPKTTISYKLTIRYNFTYYIGKCILILAGGKMAMKFLKGKRVATYTIGNGSKQSIIL